MLFKTPIVLVEVHSPPCWKLTMPDDNGDNVEMVFTVIGILSKKDLPPIETKYVMILYLKFFIINSTYIYRSGHPQFLRQSVQLTGLNTQSFDLAVAKIREIHLMIERHFVDGSLEQPVTDMFKNYKCINLATRYFTARGNNTTQAIPFSVDVDPKGILAAMAKDKYFHGPENEVKYFRMDASSESQLER